MTADTHNWCKFRKSLQRLAQEVCKACNNKMCKFSPTYKETGKRSKTKPDPFLDVKLPKNWGKVV